MRILLAQTLRLSLHLPGKRALEAHSLRVPQVTAVEVQGAGALEFLPLSKCSQLKVTHFKEMQLVCLKIKVGLSTVEHRGRGSGNWQSQVLPQSCFCDLEAMCSGFD